MSELFAVAGLAAFCALWVVVQRAAHRLDPDEPGVARGCGGCAPAERASCPRRGDCGPAGSVEAR